MKHVKSYPVFESEEEPRVSYKYYRNRAVKSEQWTFDEFFHREGAPARIDYYPDGGVELEIWYRDGAAHRTDGPAQVHYYPDGSVNDELWFLNGKLHREDGPAWIEYDENGKVELEKWYLEVRSLELSRAEWVELTPGLGHDELVELSSEDPDPEVRRAARKNPNFPEDLGAWSINLDDW